MKNFLLLICILFLGGCSLIKEPTKITINTYSLEAIQNKSYNTNKKSILISKPKISKSFNTKDILYTQKPFTYEVYKKNRWLDMPSSMVKRELIEKIRSSKIFENTIDIHSNAESNYILESSVSKIHHKYEGKKSFAILKANFKLIYKNKILKSMSFNKKILCENNTPYGFVKALNTGFNQVLDQLIEDLAK